MSAGPAIGAMKVMHCQTNLLQVVVALRTPCRLARRLNGRQQQRHENADDRNDHQQLDQGKSRYALHSVSVHHLALRR